MTLPRDFVFVLLACGLAINAGGVQAVENAGSRDLAPSNSGAKLRCRLLPQRTSVRIGEVLSGELELTNISSVTVEITWYSDPKQYLDITIKNSDGKDISTVRYGTQFSPYPGPQVLKLEPGKSYSAPVNLLGTADPHSLVPGAYTIQAIYSYDDLEAKSEVLHISLTK